MSRRIINYLLIIALITISSLPVFADSIYSMDFSLSKRDYTIDEYITGTGTVYKSGEAEPNALVTMVVESKDGKSVYDVEQYTTDSQGKFNVRFRMMKSIENGTYYIKLKSNGVERTASFTIKKETSGPPDYDPTPSRPKEEKKKSPIELGLIAIEGDNKAYLTAEMLDEKEAKEVFTYLASEEYHPISDIFDITSSRKLDKPFTLTIKFDKSKVTDPQKLGVYYFNEDTKVWEYIGGKVIREGEIEVVIDYLSKYAVIEYQKTFDDISSVPWAKNQIEVLASRQVINGINDRNFAPNDNITRAQFAKLIVESLNLKLGSQTVNFSDVKDGAWYSNSARIAASLGIVTGYDGKFDPDGLITREQMATMIVRALKYIDPNGNYVAGQQNFIDQGQISEWAKEAVAISASKELVKGLGNGLFGPQEKATRAQAAVIIYRMLELLNRL